MYLVFTHVTDSFSRPIQRSFMAVGGCRKPVLAVCILCTLYSLRKDVVNQWLEFAFCVPCIH